MTNADRLQRWNQMYDRTPERWRFQLAVWALVAIGVLNMLLTVAVGFPFALLVGLAIVAMAVVRVPYALGWLRAGGGTAEGGESSGSTARMEIAAPDWVLRANRWYDGLDETHRPFVILAALVIPGAINMLLTFAGVFPFGLLFLLAVLALVAVRAPYAAGWFKGSPAAAGGPALSMEPAAPRIGDESAQQARFSAPRPSPAPESAPVAAEPASRSAKARSNAGAAPAEPPA